MPLYLGSNQKFKVNLNNVVYTLTVPSYLPLYVLVDGINTSFVLANTPKDDTPTYNNFVEVI